MPFYGKCPGGDRWCDTQSYPELVKTCPPDSDSNILSPSISPKHVGQAFMEMQFYPPGWVQWPTWQKAVGASSCDPHMWCAAMNIDSLSLNPVTNKANNPGCLAKAGFEYVNFAFITKNGKSTGPANPLDATTGGTFTPNAAKDLFMNSGDHLSVAFGDTPNGHPGRDHQLRAKRSVRHPAAAGLHAARWLCREHLSGFPEHHPQPVPAVVAAAAPQG